MKEIERLEQERCRALVAGDVQVLSALLAENLVHIHSSGKVEGKAAYLEGVVQRLRFRDVLRGQMSFLVLTDAVIATGPLEQTVEYKAGLEKKHMRLITSQVWIRSGSGWLQTHYQATCT